MPIDSLWPFGQKKPAKQPKKSKEEGYAALVKVLVPVEKLTVGMYVTELDRPWVETPFLFQGFEIRNEEELHAIRDVCNYVYVDVTKRRNVTKEMVSHVRADSTKTRNNLPTKNVLVVGQTPETLNYDTPPRRLSGFEKEIERANRVYSNAETVVENFIKSVENGGGIDSVAAQKAVAHCVESILHSPDAMLWLAQLKAKDEYTARHSLNVCILSIVLGRHINLSARDLNTVGLCGMMHDVGKLLIPPEILHKTSPLNEEERRTLKTHTRLGYNLLKSSNMNSAVAVVALTHHEQLDGRGYPRRLLEPNISFFAKMVAITNAYDGMTNDKPHQRGKTHLEATHILTNLSGSHFDPMLVIKFIECIGVYPPGSLVEMTNGAVAMVIEVHEKSKLRPRVILILDEKKRPVPEQVLDLSMDATDSQDNVYVIKNIIKAKDWNLDVSKYYREGLLKKGLGLKR